MARAERAIAGAGLLLVLAAAAGGCAGTHPQKGLWTEVDFDRVRAIEVPAALREGPKLPPVAVAVTVIDPPPPEDADPPDAGEQAEGEGESDPISFEPQVLGDELVSALAATGIFERVFAVRVPNRDLVVARRAAYEAGASFMIEATFTRPRLRCSITSIVVPMLVWCTAGFPSMWFENHRFTLKSQVSLRLHGLATGEALPEKPLPDIAAEEGLNFHERTSGVWRYFTVYILPSPFLPSPDGDKCARFLAASGLRQPVQSFLGQIAEALRGEVYAFAAEAHPGGPRIRIAYPPTDGRPVYLLSRAPRHAAVIEGGDAPVREVRVNGKRVFPARSAVGQVGWRAVDIVELVELKPGASWRVEAVDARGRTSVCRVGARKLAARPPAGAKAAASKGASPGSGGK